MEWTGGGYFILLFMGPLILKLRRILFVFLWRIRQVFAKYSPSIRIYSGDERGGGNLIVEVMHEKGTKHSQYEHGNIFFALAGLDPKSFSFYIVLVLRRTKAAQAEGVEHFIR